MCDHLKKQVLFATLVLTSVLLLVGCSSDNNAEPKRGSSTSVSWTEGYANVSEMEAAADIGIVGILSDSETELRGNIVFTRNTVEVVAVHSGNVRVGDFVEVLQTGGEFGDISTPAFSEAPLMEANKEYAMFLKETEPNEEYGQYYLIAGGYQGLAEIKALSTISNTANFTDYFADNFN